ncbi:hypothetical protein TYRP_023609 [Tyrophagus putrescentiae]|nr:hypothetical protein TYRP_023609 [Tyrophagus putrescentiae]
MPIAMFAVTSFPNMLDFELLVVMISFRSGENSTEDHHSKSKDCEQPIEYYDPFFEDPGIYDDARRLSNRFEANQVTCSLDPNKWTPCSSKKALKSSQKPKADTGKTKKGTNLSEAFAKLVTESSS